MYWLEKMKVWGHSDGESFLKTPLIDTQWCALQVHLIR
jgi:hypothetical protein